MKAKTSRLWTKRYIFLLLSNLFVYLGFFMLVPTLPAYTKEIGGSAFQVSLVIGIFSVTALLLRIVTGVLADISGRKPLLITGLVILMISTAAYNFLHVSGILAMRLINGIGWGLASTSFATSISDIVPRDRTGEGMGYYSLAVIISMSVSPVIAIMLMNAFDFGIITILSGVLVFIGLLLLIFIQIPKMESKKVSKFKAVEIIEKKALLPSVLCFVLSITLCGIMSYILLYGKELQMNNIWIYFIGHVSMILITRTYVGKIYDKRGHKAVIFPGAVFMLAGLIALSYVSSVTTLVIASLLYGLGYGTVQPSLQAWAIDRSPEDRKASVNATFLSSIDLGYAAGSLILSFFAEAFSFAVMYRISSIFMGIFLVIYGTGIIREKTYVKGENGVKEYIA